MKPDADAPLLALLDQPLLELNSDELLRYVQELQSAGRNVQTVKAAIAKKVKPSTTTADAASAKAAALLKDLGI